MIKAPPMPWRAPLVMSDVETGESSADELAWAGRQWDRLARNAEWFEAHAHGIYAAQRDCYVCVAGQALFVAATADAAVAAAKAAHPDDDGRILRRIPPAKLARV